MSRETERNKTNSARIDRLRMRLRVAQLKDPEDPVVPIIAGLLDLLEDRLR